MKKSAPALTAEHDHVSPRETREWEDDVTDEGIEKVRDRARQHPPKGKLELVDGFGRYLDA